MGTICTIAYSPRVSVTLVSDYYCLHFFAKRENAERQKTYNQAGNYKPAVRGAIISTGYLSVCQYHGKRGVCTFAFR